MSIVGGQPNPDAVILFSSVAPAGANVGASIDTKGSASVVWEISSNTSFQMTIEGSNDQQSWVTLWVLSLSEVSQIDNINENGHYSIDVATRYIRYNIAYSGDVLTNLVYGRNSSSASAAGRLSLALDQTSNVSLSASIVNLKKDVTGALIASDAVGPFVANLLNATSLVIYDTTGYNNIVVQQIGGGSTAITISNDGLNWLSVQGINLQTGGAVTGGLSAASLCSFACAARYIRFTGTATAGQLVSYFRATNNPSTVGVINLAEVAGAAVSAAAAQLGTNQVQYGATAVVNSGVAGSPGVGGAIAVNATASVNPVIVGGSDNNNVARRLLAVNPTTKTSMGGVASPTNIGVLATGGLDQANNTQIQSYVSGSYQNVPAIPVMDVTEHEGVTTAQILTQILIELQILNHQLHQLPLLLNNGIATTPDEPAALRQEPSLFNQ